MTNSQKINLALFASFCIVIMSFAYLFGTDFLGKQEKPWHMQNDIQADSLSALYRAQYKIMGPQKVAAQIKDAEKRLIILVDSWGVPFDENVLNSELSAFRDVSHTLALHYRLSNRTKHAEQVELRKDSSSAIYLFGGDTLEYGRHEYIPELGYQEMLLCNHCSDGMMVAKIDSLLGGGVYATIAWTSQDSRYGDVVKLRKLLGDMASLAEKYPDVQIVIIGAHRPILGSPERRREFYAHWVPVVILNEF